MTRPTEPARIAVLDVGKTNLKLLVASEDGWPLETHSIPNAATTSGPYLAYDLARLGARPHRGIVTGICWRLAGSGGVCEGEQLEEVVGGADHRPLGAHFCDAPQQELAESARLFDLSEHRFHHLLSQSVGRFEAAVVDLLSHSLGQ